MTKDKIIYWTSTGIVAAIMLWSAFNFSLNAEMKGAFVHLGLPNWFRIELTVAKILGALALLIPTIPNRIKEFAYCGFAITLISAVIAHSSSGDGIASLDPLLFLGILTVSYFYYYKTRLHKQAATGLKL
jgi:DoxX-like family